MGVMQHVGISVLAALVAAAPAASDEIAEFYRGKTVTLVVPSTAGGIYAASAQIISRHLGKHIPGKPSVVPNFMPGAGGVKAQNYLYTAAPKDGTHLGTPLTGVAQEVVLRPESVRYDPLKFHWLGAWSEANVSLCILKTAGVTTLEQAKQKQVILGATGKATATYQIPAALNGLVGTKFKMVTGYRGGGPIRIAMEKGEVHGWAGFWEGWKRSTPQWVKEKQIACLVQLARARAPDLADVPTLIELAKDEDTKKVFQFMTLSGVVGRAYIAPPGVTTDKVALLQKAFEATLTDKALIADMAKAGMELEPIPAAEVREAVAAQLSLTPAQVAKVKQIFGNK